MQYYDIIIIGNSSFNDFTYSYDGELEFGCRVLVQFGTSAVPGVVYRKTEYKKDFKIKPIEAVVDKKPVLTEKDKKFIEMTANDTLLSKGQIVKMILSADGTVDYSIKIIPLNPLAGFEKPINMREFYKKFKDRSTADKSMSEMLKQNIISLEILERSEIKVQGTRAFTLAAPLHSNEKTRISPQSRQVVNFLLLNGQATEKQLIDNKIIKKSSSVLSTLLKSGIITEHYEDLPIYQQEPSDETELTDEQEKAVRDIYVNREKTHLLYGVTGSGKTEVFLQIIEPLINNHEQILIMIPEISLIWQYVQRLQHKFRTCRIGIYNSELTFKEKKSIMEKTMNGQTDIIIGTRSAVWLRFKKLGMIIIDEEHDSSFYQMEGNIYDSIHIAQIKKQIESSYLLLSSATPRIIDFFESSNGNFMIHRIKKRYNVTLPDIELIDLSKEEKYNWIFSVKIIKSIKDVLDRNKKVIVFTPTKGYANYIICTNCGHIFRCKNCDISMTYYKQENHLKCHYCDNTQPVPSVCPKCGSTELQTRGFGTERVMNELIRIFPSQPMVRVDRQAVKSSQDVQETFKYINNPGRMIIIGTKMITKGLNIPDLELVVVLDCERYFNMPDYNASENSSALLMQVAGRSGRKERGRVMIQSFNPKNELYKFILNHDYDSIISAETENRKKYLYPPFTNLIIILVKDSQEENLNKKALKIYKSLCSDLDRKMLLGPVKPSVYKLNNFFRLSIIVKISTLDLQIFRQIYSEYRNSVSIYINPPTTMI
ncbi:MAG: primosomal protein N' [Petrotogaceae bacterium]|jgi:primosomal protein N' (replication factor Y)|nr:primosomal protein N' [Petrotogaceae bacterium]